MFKYAQKEGLDFSCFRLNKKDNCFVEQKSRTQVKKHVSYWRYDTLKELKILNAFCRDELGPYKNFFQPVIKLISKERISGKIHRKYDVAKTPYQRVMESKEVSLEKKKELKRIYESLNPAELKRVIDRKLVLLCQACCREKQKSQKVEPQRSILVRFLTAQPEPVLLT